ncbi:DUF3795 domain-containing protein [Desulfosporosinus sp. OT]|uniref:DUF3795 domain-containing protein n=1 Tax=Desulfosporosinus sp. OT TaxID=913865 RepID=UPI000223ACB1|nr:DUF3795 domain-containing protein [Desulfosporosinus sp. OT]EGW36984.1 hypothetical protein DOT_5174 [Desulfosporosinus sp. OT]
MSNELIAYCGLYCGACSFKVGFEENNMEHIISMPSIYDNFKNTPPEFCPGCRLENQCGDCDIRTCARDKKIEYCSLCDDFPCVKLMNFTSDGKPHHAKSIENLILLKDIGEEKWLEVQQEKWKCKCNTKYSWYMTKCVNCKE